MRDIRTWHAGLRKKLRDHWASTEPLTPAALCEIELGLFLLDRVAPNVPVHSLWVLMTGYPFPTIESIAWTEKQRRMIGNARHLLPYYRNAFQWRRALERYRQVNERLRAYDIDEHFERCTPREVSIAAGRTQSYEAALRNAPPYQRDLVQWAQAGTHLFLDGGRWSDVHLSPDVILDRPVGHSPASRAARTPLHIPWSELIETARWMDAESAKRELQPAAWEDRLARVQLEIFDQHGTELQRVDILTIDGLMHLIGMVSAGKSTLMDVLAVWMAHHDLRITVVVGDVISALNRAQLFLQLGIPAAPILGASNRERHTNRLHRVVQAESPHTPLVHNHLGFHWLSSACPLDGLRATAKPIKTGMNPCLTLYPTSNIDDDDDQAVGQPVACPFYSFCPRHQAQRDLVAAKIWIATPASLVYTRVAQQLNAERLRFAELIYQSSDLVVVDEADQVQVQLDMMFSPNQTLVSRGSDAWLGRLWQQVIPQLNQQGRGQLAEEAVSTWCQAHDTAQAATSRIYTLLLHESALRHKIEENYFTDWMLLDRIALELSGAPTASPREHQGYQQLRSFFEEYLADPLGDNRDHPLADLVRQVIAVTNETQVRQRIGKWIETHSGAGTELSEQVLANLVVRLEFALLVAVLQNRLDMLFRLWRQVEGPLALEGGSSILFHRPPEDYSPVMPAAPMGNVLAFQYLRTHDDMNQPGDLRFFRCLGVGRWLLLHLHELFQSDGIVGPHVLLLSGTSWAGTSPSNHLQAPVSGVLRAPKEEIAAIEQSSFKFEPLYDNAGQAITISGTTGNARAAALKEMLYQLARPGGLGGPSLLERERMALPVGRQRILLLVGSYDEAKIALETLEQIRPDWRGQMRRLVPDDDNFESEWRSSDQTLQRGLVSQLAATGAWLLIAPLLAVERGHNILNEQHEAAIGSAYFLVRPHPRPDDIGFAIHSINRWAVDRHRDAAWFARRVEGASLTLDRAGDAFRDAAFGRWRALLRLPMVFSTLPVEDRNAVTWTQLVTIWQVIGRLVRGGCPARIYFCDAAFARRTAASEEHPDFAATSLLVSMKQVLQPYFSTALSSHISPTEQVLVRALYGPLYAALERMGGIADATV